MKEYATRTLIGNWFVAMTVTAIASLILGAATGPGIGPLLLVGGLMPPAIMLMLWRERSVRAVAALAAGASLTRRALDLVPARVD